MRPTQVYAAIQRTAREAGRPVDELLTLYGLERFLARLGQTQYARDFALKGGVLLAAYRLRRPTSDIDIQALDFRLDEEHLRAVVAAVAAVDSDDALALAPSDARVEQIRDEDEYTGLRVHVRGTTSTRWRDLVDVRNLARTYPFTAADLAAAGRATAAHRQVVLRPLAGVTEGYGTVGQSKWQAWLRKHALTDSALPNLDEQVAAVSAFIDPVYGETVRAGARWNPDTYTWTTDEVA